MLPAKKIAFLLFYAAIPAGATTITMTPSVVSDTYLDSFNDGSGLLYGDNADTNYGQTGSLKAVSASQGSQGLPAPSLCHAVFTLPQQLFTDAPTGVSSATLTFKVRNSTLAGQSVELHPLLQRFTAGTGGVYGTTSKTAGSLNTGATKYGADWNAASYNSDGSKNPWSLNGTPTPGAPYASDAPIPTYSISGSNYITFNITALLDNAKAYAEVQQYGLLLRLSNETNSAGSNDFITLESSESANSAYVPVLNYTVPEPASVCVIALAGMGLLRRRRK